MSDSKTAVRTGLDGAAVDSTQSVLDSIRRIVAVLRSSSRRAEKEVGLSGAQLFVLQKLRGGPKLSLNELAQRTRTHQSSASVVVQRLVDAGLVTRGRARTDARRVELSLTPAAHSLLRKAPGAAQDRLIAALDHMPKRSLAELARLLQVVVERMYGSDEPPPMFLEEIATPGRSGENGDSKKGGAKAKPRRRL